MTVLTPGVAFLGRGFACFSMYLSTAYYGIVKIAESQDVSLPTWTVIAGAVVAAPVLGRLYVVYRNYSRRRRAAQLGARLVPKCQGKVPGNLDIMKISLDSIAFGYPGDGLNQFAEEYGPCYDLYLMHTELFVTTQPEHIKAILANEFHNFQKGPKFYVTMGSVLGTGVFNSDGDMWKFHRTITRPVFARERVSDFDIFDRHAAQVVLKIKERLNEGYPVDFQDVMLRFTLDTATDFLFGSSVDALSAGFSYPHNASRRNVESEQSASAKAADEFSWAFAKCQEIIAVRERMSWMWPLAEIRRDLTEVPMKIVKSYIEPIVQAAIERKRGEPNIVQVKEEKSAGQDDKTLLDYLLQSTTDPTVLRDEILNIMIAGRDTTASTLTWCIYLLSQHRNVLERLRAEILEKVGPMRRPDFDDLKELKYMRAVINETLRLYPAVPFNVRESINETIWPSPDPSLPPLYLPPGTKVAYSVFMMQRRKDLWGPDAEEFDPDRFLDERLQKYHLKNHFIFLPFNAGPRICLGQQYAYNQMSYMLVRLLQTFSEMSLDLASIPPEAAPPAFWTNSPGRKATEKVWPKLHLTLYVNGGLWVNMREAELTEA
ncbi:cytochrome P450 monooxygenase pc-1 [Coprinellus micaceus]|uniref:Cytochrome P450 monooxygenase pc-1 n=1 Tax=Coprinellus micaceus TaxID=71717 RepID=A0A4Y7SQ80_COPMI|nr:cytochrome P450 monooxygenase pc-1 [Coprinellus micaceus]